MSKKLGLQLNGCTTVRSPLVGSIGCICCTCCDNTRQEFYNQNGTIWLVSTDGTIGVLLPGATEFEVKYHARRYFSWRLGSPHGNTFVRHPVRLPNVQNIAFSGTVMFPYFRDLIGFQTDVDQCVIFNEMGEQLYEGAFDGRRFPLLFNGETNEIREYSDFVYATAPIRFPVINDKWTARWGDVGRIRFTAEEKEGEEGTYPLTDRLAAGFAAVAWKTDFESHRTDGQRCGYVAEGVWERHSVSRDYSCPRPPESPPGQAVVSDHTPIMPRNRVRKVVLCTPFGGHEGEEPQWECEPEMVNRYHRCATEFKPETPLTEQIQGFDLSICGNFVRVVYRNARVQSNKWYRYVGNVASRDELPQFLPRGINLQDAEAVAVMLNALSTPLAFDEQDEWGMPTWWRRFVQTYYVYGAHPTSQWQWMRFQDQRRADIPKIAWLEVPDSLADDARRERIQAALAADAEPDKRDLVGFCEPSEGVELAVSRTVLGSVPPFWLEGNAPQAYDPFDPKAYGIRYLDVMSVGSGSAPDSHKSWYYFDGFDWIEGEGSYQDLKNWSTEDLSFVFYKGVEGLNQCSGEAHVIPADLHRLQCCGDYLLVGLGTDFESRMIFLRDKKIVERGLERPPTAEQYEKESFACCDSFFGYSMLDTTNRVLFEFYNVSLDTETGQVLRQTKLSLPQEIFPVAEAPQFGGCSSNCRYYFVRQSEKRGIYFYRDDISKSQSTIEYSPWRHMLSLNIDEDSPNVAPSAGCASTSNICYIPCQSGTITGTQRWINGRLESEKCEPSPSGYTECSDSEPNVVECSNDNVMGVATVSGRLCRSYSNIGASQPECWSDPTFDLTSESFVVRGSFAGSEIDNDTGSGSGSGSGYGDGYGSGSGYGEEEIECTYVFRASTDIGFWSGTVYSAHKCYSGSVYGSHSFTDYSVIYCGTQFRLQRQSDMKIVDTAKVSGGDDPWGGLVGSGDFPFANPTWGVSRHCGSWVTSVCRGSVSPGFTLPCRSVTVHGPYGCNSTWTAGFTGRLEDAYCSYHQFVMGTPHGYGGAISCVSSGVTRYKRLTGTIYVVDPYNGRFIEVNTGLAGTFCTESIPGSCFDTARTYSVCIDGISYTIVLSDPKRNDGYGYGYGDGYGYGHSESASAPVVLISEPIYNDENRTVNVFVDTYPGSAVSCTSTPFGGVQLAPDALLCRWYSGVDLSGRPVCISVTTNNLCRRSVFCGTASALARFADGTILDEGNVVSDGGTNAAGQALGAITVRVRHEGSVYIYVISGITTETRFSFRACCGFYTILDVDGKGHFYYKDEELDILPEGWIQGACCGEAIVIRNTDTGRQRVFIEGVEIENLSDIFKNDPHNNDVANDHRYPLSVDCAGGYYLFYTRQENKIEWANEYTAVTREFTLKAGGGFEDGEGQWEEEGDANPPPIGFIEPNAASPSDALSIWKETSMPQCRMVLLDGTECEAIDGQVIQTRVAKYNDFVKVGPSRWRTKGISRAAVIGTNGKELYPAVEEYEFDDPLAPWWDEGVQQANTHEGVMSLLRTLMGIDPELQDSDLPSDPLESTRRALALRESQLENAKRSLNLATVTANAVCALPLHQGQCFLAQAEVSRWQGEIPRLQGMIDILKSRLARLESGDTTILELPPAPPHAANKRCMEGDEQCLQMRGCGDDAFTIG